MERAHTLQQINGLLSNLSNEKLKEVADFASFLHNKQQQAEFQRGIEKLAEQSGALDFLENDECIYTLDDITAKY